MGEALNLENIVATASEMAGREFNGPGDIIEYLNQEYKTFSVNKMQSGTFVVTADKGRFTAVENEGLMTALALVVVWSIRGY